MIHVVIGTKAQLIKMAPILAELKQRNIDFNYISTGQHKDTMLEIIDCFDIKTPDYHLYQGNDITSVVKMLFWSLRIIGHSLFHKKAIFQNDNDGIVLVHGDTFSTLLGAIIAKLNGLKVGHVESGLRSFHLFHPFPEELTRLLVFRLTDIFFCPDSVAMRNIKKYKGLKINTGANTLRDALNIALPKIKQIDVDIPDQPFAIATLHRFENISNVQALTRIINIIEKISESIDVLFILHKPTLLKLQKFALYERLKNNKRIECRPRYDYFHFVKLMLGSEFIISDGGSNQEECAYLGKPILLLRKASERQEGLGKNCLISEYDMDKINAFVSDYSSYQQQSTPLMQQKPTSLIIDTCQPFS